MNLAVAPSQINTQDEVSGEKPDDLRTGFPLQSGRGLLLQAKALGDRVRTRFRKRPGQVYRSPIGFLSKGQNCRTQARVLSNYVHSEEVDRLSSSVHRPANIVTERHRVIHEFGKLAASFGFTVQSIKDLSADRDHILPRSAGFRPLVFDNTTICSPPKRAAALPFAPQRFRRSALPSTTTEDSKSGEDKTASEQQLLAPERSFPKKRQSHYRLPAPLHIKPFQPTYEVTKNEDEDKPMDIKPSIPRMEVKKYEKGHEPKNISLRTQQVRNLILEYTEQGAKIQRRVGRIADRLDSGELTNRG